MMITDLIWYNGWANATLPLFVQRVPLLSLGVRLSDHSVVWGDVVPSLSHLPTWDCKQDEQEIEQIAVQLRGTELTSWRVLAEQLRPCNDALRFGLEQVLLRAVAYANQRSVVQQIALEWNVEVATSPSIHVEDGNIADFTMLEGVSSVGFRTASRHAQFALGEQAVGLQGQVRELCKRLSAETNITTLQLDFQGSLGQLYDHKIGKLGGALYGFEQAVGPIQLQVANVSKINSAETESDLAQFFRFRRMKTQLVAQATSAQYDVLASPAHVIHVDIAAMGSIADAIDLMVAVKATGKKLVVDCVSAETPHITDLLANIALAVQADFVVARPATIAGVSAMHNATVRILKEINV